MFIGIIDDEIEGVGDDGTVQSMPAACDQRCGSDRSPVGLRQLACVLGNGDVTRNHWQMISAAASMGICRFKFRKIPTLLIAAIMMAACILTAGVILCDLDGDQS